MGQESLNFGIGFSVLVAKLRSNSEITNFSPFFLVNLYYINIMFKKKEVKIV